MTKTEFLLKMLIPNSNVVKILRETVRIVTNKILGVKGLINENGQPQQAILFI